MFLLGHFWPRWPQTPTASCVFLPLLRQGVGSPWTSTGAPVPRMSGVWGVSTRFAVPQRWALGFRGVARLGRGLGGIGGSDLTDFLTGPRVIPGVENTSVGS